MKEGWEYSTIGDLCDKLNGLWKGKKGPFINVGVIRNANFTKDFTLSFENIEYLDVEAKQYETRKLQKGDLIVEKSGGSEKQPVGRTVLFNKEDGEYSFSNFTSVLRIKDKSIITPEFLYKYILFVYMRGDTRKMQKATTGIHNIEFDKFLSIPVPFISLSEQQSIVDYLESAFAKIDAMKANAEKALNEAKALFQASLKEMLEPKEGWEEKKLKEICETVTDFVAAGSFASLRENVVYNNEKDYAQLVRTTDLKSGFSKGGYVFVNEHAFNYLYRVNLDKECIILPNVGVNCGEVYYVTPSKLPYNKNVLGPNAVLVRSNNYNNHFLSYLFLGKDFQNKLRDITSHMAQPKFNKTSLKEILVLVPPLSEQQSIVATLDSLKSKVDRLQANFEKISQECDALKQAILRQVFE